MINGQTAENRYVSGSVFSRRLVPSLEDPAQSFNLSLSGKLGTVHLAENETNCIFSAITRHRRIESNTDVRPFSIFESVPRQISTKASSSVKERPTAAHGSLLRFVAKGPSVNDNLCD